MLATLGVRIKRLVDNRLMPILLEILVVMKFNYWNRSVFQHNLRAPLIVSLTSYPARFSTLALTLKCLLMQSMRPDRLVLWIATEEMLHLPKEVVNLQAHGLEIRECENIKSYKKIVPALELFGDCYIVTADDDLYYDSNWLRDLVKNTTEGSGEVVCHRAHCITLNGMLMPDTYSNWKLESHDVGHPELIFPTTGAGVLYPPNTFSSEVYKRDTFMKLCPKADDVWLYWMMHMNGRLAKVTPMRRQLYTWRTTQKEALWRSNVTCGENDRQISAMIDRYGFSVRKSAINLGTR